MTSKTLIDITPEQEKAIVEGKDILASKQRILTQAGRASAFGFIRQVSEIAELKMLKSIKEDKEYKGLLYFDNEGNRKQVSTWAEFCEHFQGMSYKTIDERLLNLSTFSENFLEESAKLGLGYRELRALRQLPDDEQALVIESQAVEAGDKEAVKELIDELKAKHKKETATLKEELNAADSMLRANRKMSSDNAVKMQELQEQLAAKKFGTDKWQSDVKDFFAVLHKTHNAVNESLNQLLKLNEQLEYTQLDERAKDTACAAFYADNKLMVEQVVLCWNEIHRTWAHVAETAKPSGEILATLGFEGLEE